MYGSHRQGISLMAPRARALLLVALVAFAGLVIGMMRAASDAGAAPKPKVVVCHATSSETNPYVQIEVSQKGVDGEGKNDHTSHENDIIAPSGGVCPDSVPPGGGNDHKVDVCHVTGSESNPVVMINIAQPAVQAHLDHGDYLADEETGCTIVPDGPGPNTGGDPSKAPASATVTETASSVAGAAPSSKAARACTSRRSFRIRVRSKRRDPVVSATVSVNGKRVASRKGKRVTAPVVLRGLARGTYAVKITATTRRGRKLSGTRRYKTCAKKSARKTIPLL